MASSEDQKVLELVAKIRDEASSVLDQLGATGEANAEVIEEAIDKKVTSSLDRAAKRAKELEQGLGPIGVKFQELGKRAQTGMNKIVAGWGDVKRAEGMADAGTLQFAEHFATAFATGGPVGAAVAGVTTLVGVLIGQQKQAVEEAKRLKEERRDLAEQEADRLERLAERAKGGEQGGEDRIFAEELRIRQARSVIYNQDFDARVELEQRTFDLRLDAMRKDMRETRRVIHERFAAMQQASGEWLEEEKRAYASANALYSEQVREYKQTQREMGLAHERRIMEAEAREVEQWRQIQIRETEAASRRRQAEEDRKAAMRERLQDAARIASMSEEDRQYAQRILEIEDLRRANMEIEAGFAERLLDYDKARAEWLQKRAKLESLEGRKNEVDQSLAREVRMYEMRQKYSAEILTLWQKYNALILQGADAQKVHAQYAKELADLKDRQTDQQIEYTESILKQIEYLRLETDEAREQYEWQEKINEAREKGSEAAVQHMKTLLELQKQVREEAENELEARAKAAGVEVRGGRVDKGLASRRDARRDRNRQRKYVRQGQAFGAFGQNLRFDRDIHDGSFSGLGGIRSGRRADQEGPASQWYGGSPDRGTQDWIQRNREGKGGAPGLDKKPEEGAPGLDQPKAPGLDQPSTDLSTEIAKLKEEVAAAKTKLDEERGAFESAITDMKGTAEKQKEVATQIIDFMKEWGTLNSELDKALGATGEGVKLNATKIQELMRRLEQLQRDMADAERLASG